MVVLEVSHHQFDEMVLRNGGPFADVRYDIVYVDGHELRLIYDGLQIFPIHYEVCFENDAEGLEFKLKWL